MAETSAKHDESHRPHDIRPGAAEVGHPQQTSNDPSDAEAGGLSTTHMLSTSTNRVGEASLSQGIEGLKYADLHARHVVDVDE